MEQNVLDYEADQLRKELSEANDTIARLTSMLERSFSVIEALGGGEAPPITMDADRLDDAPLYMRVDDVAEMLGCTNQTAAKLMREHGAASFGKTLIVKRDVFLAAISTTGTSNG